MSKKKATNGLGVGIRQRSDGRYEARARINGKDICLYNKNLKKLKSDFEEAKLLARNNYEVMARNITLNEWFDEWFEKYKAPRIRDTSVFPMRSKFLNTFGKEIGDMKLQDIRNIDIQSTLNRMQEDGRAASSMREALGRVRQCLESAKHNKLIHDNPCYEIFVPWENKKVKRIFLSHEEQRIFLNAVENNWYKEMFHIMFLTGMRIGEVGGLVWSDIDFEKKHIHIQRSLTANYENGNKKLYFGPVKTTNSNRFIPFLGNVEEVLRAQKKKDDDLKKHLGSRYRGKGEFSELVFVTSMGSPVMRHHAEKEVKKIIHRIDFEEALNANLENREPEKFKDLYPHAIRHTFCSRCFEVDMNPKVVQSLMGHQNYSTTIEIYTHVSKEKFDSEVLKLDDVFVTAFNMKTD